MRTPGGGDLFGIDADLVGFEDFEEELGGMLV